jgi:starch-binding outer membrane protein, SusD/RagB family
MKTIKILFITALTVAFALGSCNKALDLKPFQSIDQSQALLTSNDVQITLVGAYNLLTNGNLYGGGIFVDPDLMATQNVTEWTGTFQGLTQMVDQQIPINNAFVEGVWLAAYAAINSTNNVLSALDKVNAADKDRVEGEAKFIRGLTYFDLARLFGRAWNDGDPAVNLAVPIVLTPTKSVDASSLVSRSTVAQVYQQAINDLSTAESKLPVSNSFYASKYSAAAILARLYLQKGDYLNAVSEATNVISSGNYSLNANYADEFPYPGRSATHIDNTSEDIFAIQFTAQTVNVINFNDFNTEFASSNDGGRGDIAIDQSFVDEFADSDTRKALFYDDSGSLRTDKFSNIDGNAHVIRLAELYLIRAEANLRISATSTIGDKPANDVNTIRARAGIAPLAFVTVNDVLTERRHELCFEGGFFLHDAKRTLQNVNGLPYNSPKLVFPIPQVEINANPKLVQNAGY